MSGSKIRGLSLFSGNGGIDLALGEWVETIGYCEIDRYSQHILISRMVEGSLPFAPIYPDVSRIKGSYKDCEIIFGGFPCQDISIAGAGKGLAGERSGLFYEIIRLTKEIRPSFVFLENVPAIRTRGLEEVIKAFTEIGYDCRWTCLSAASIGAPHKRERWFLLAHANGNNLRKKSDGESERQSQAELGNDGEKEFVANTDSKRLERQREKSCRTESKFANFSDNSWWTVEPDVGGAFNGFAAWLDKGEKHIHKSHQRIAAYAISEEKRPDETLRILREKIEQEALWEKTRGSQRVSAQEVLQSYLQRIQERATHKAWLLLESEEVSKDELRVMWRDEEFTRSPYRPKPSKQHKKEYPDSLQVLSQLLALDAEAAWSDYRWQNAKNELEWKDGWEDGFARVTDGTPFRVDRIKSCGNGVVPLQVKTAFRRLVGL